MILHKWPIIKTLLLVATPLTFLFPAAAQTGTGSTHVVFRIPIAGYLGIRNLGSSAAWQEGSGNGNERQLRVRIRPLSADGKVLVPLIARTNTSYRLLASVSRSSGALEPGVKIEAVSVFPNAGGAQLMPGATDVRMGAATISSTLDEAVVAEGSRISRGGNNSTPDNALMIHLQVELPPGASQADLLFKLQLNSPAAGLF